MGIREISHELAARGNAHVVVAAPLQPAHTTMALFHGTDEAHAKDILKHGLLVGRLAQGRSQQAPRAGYVYVSKDIMYAVGYAGAYTKWGYGCKQERINGTEKFTAYVFVVDTAAAGDILVDEDVLGEYGTSTREYPNVPAPLLDYIRYAARMCSTPKQLQRAKQGEMAPQSAIGKKMQKFIPNTQMLALIDACPHLALHHANGIPIVGYYTLNESVATPEQFKAAAKYHAITVVASESRASLSENIVEQGLWSGNQITTSSGLVLETQTSIRGIVPVRVEFDDSWGCYRAWHSQVPVKEIETQRIYHPGASAGQEIGLARVPQIVQAEFNPRGYEDQVVRVCKDAPLTIKEIVQRICGLRGDEAEIRLELARAIKRGRLSFRDSCYAITSKGREYLATTPW